MASWDFPRGPLGTRQFVQVGRAHGLAAATCLRGTGLTAAELTGSRQIEARQELQVASNLVGALGDRPGLGVEAGRGFTATGLGIWGFAVASSPTWRDALDVGLRFLPLTEAYLRPELTVTDEGIALQLHDDEIPDEVRTLVVERDLASLIAFLKSVLDVPPPATLDTTLNGARFEALSRVWPQWTIRAGRSRHALIGTEDFLNSPLADGDELSWRVSTRGCQDLLDRRARRTGVSAAVRTHLIANPGATTSMTEAAATLHLDARTLHRRLAAEGTSFRTLRNEVNEALATALLTTVGLSVDQVARRLGYADATSFHHAYRRWTGHSPSHAGGADSCPS